MDFVQKDKPEGFLKRNHMWAWGAAAILAVALGSYAGFQNVRSMIGDPRETSAKESVYSIKLNTLTISGETATHGLHGAFKVDSPVKDGEKYKSTTNDDRILVFETKNDHHQARIYKVEQDGEDVVESQIWVGELIGKLVSAHGHDH